MFEFVKKSCILHGRVFVILVSEEKENRKKGEIKKKY